MDTMDTIIARIQISELAARYNAAADDGPIDQYLETFVPDGALEVVGLFTWTGYEDLAAVLADGPGRTLHVTSNEVIAIDGDSATMSSVLQLFRRSTDRLVNDLVTTGRYDDQLRLTGEGWRFVRRRCTLHTAGHRLAELTAPR